MSLNIETKKVAVEEIGAAIANAQTLVVAEYRGISVSSMTELRANARKEGVYLRVLKNTLARRAVEGTSFAGLADQMVGPLVYAASEDAVAAAKVLHQFAKKDDKIIVKAGSYNGEVMNPAQVAELASIQVAKSCCPNCCSLCKLLYQALHVVWLLWQRKSWRRSRLIDFVSFNQLFLIQYLEYK